VKYALFSDRLHEPPVPLFDKRRVGNVPLLLLDDDLRAGHIAREPLSMLPGHEHVGQAVDDPSWHADFGNVEAPWLEEARSSSTQPQTPFRNASLVDCRMMS
jgi:hypothetical protein